MESWGVMAVIVLFYGYLFLWRDDQNSECVQLFNDPKFSTTLPFPLEKCQVITKGGYAAVWHCTTHVLRIGKSEEETQLGCSLTDIEFVEDTVRESLHENSNLVIKRWTSYTVPQDDDVQTFHVTIYDAARGGDLQDFMDRRFQNGCMQHGDSTRLALVLVDKVYALHTAGFVHCDLRLANVLIMEDAKICEKNIVNIPMVLHDFSRTRPLSWHPNGTLFTALYPPSARHVPEYAPGKRVILAEILQRNFNLKPYRRTRSTPKLF